MGYYIIACGVGLIQFDHIIIIVICGALPPEQPEMEIKTTVLFLLKESKKTIRFVRRNPIITLEFIIIIISCIKIKTHICFRLPSLTSHSLCYLYFL